MQSLKPQSVPLALRDFAALVGREEPLYLVHAALLRTSQTIRPVVESGALLAACSDEFNGEVRAAFERDVARRLTAPNVPGARRVFSISNLGGRIEPGAIALANLHFTSLSTQAGEKLLVIEIASHVGRNETSQGQVWGELDRFGTTSPCCGALQLLLDIPPGSEAVRFPWFEQLKAFFGPERLDALRADTSPYRMLRAAIVHAVLQAETAIVDLLREPPHTPTQILLVPLVVVNRRGTDNAIAVGLHQLRFEAGVAQFVFGTSLRSTPSALNIDASQRNLRVRSPLSTEPEVPVPAPALAKPSVAPRLREQAGSKEVRTHLDKSRKQYRALHGPGQGLQVYARPLLRALLQGLSLVAPEVALGAFALEVGSDLLRAEHTRKLLERGPTTEEARTLLRELEPSLQQLSQREARAVLEALLAKEHSLFGGRGG